MYGGGRQNQTSTTQVTYSPEEQAFRNFVMQQAQNAYNQSGGPNAAVYTGPRPVGPSGSTQTGWQHGASAALSIGQGNTNAQQANNQHLTASNVGNNKHLQAAIDAATRPMINQFTQAGGPLATIRNNAVNTGTYGGSRQGIAEGLAAQGLQQKVGDMRSMMMSDAYYKGLAAEQDAIKNQAMLNMMHQQPGMIWNQIGAQQEGYQQAQNNYDAAAAHHAQNYMWKPLNNLANIIYGGSNPTTTQTQQGPKPDNTGQIIGTLGSMAMMYMMM